MEDIIIKIIAGTIATLGFAILFRLKPSHWPFAMLDGLFACVCYFAFTELFGGNFLPNLLAAFVASVFADLFARLCKAPSTVFILPGCIALVPGGTLYYAMSNLLSENRDVAVEYFLITLTVGIGIGGGIIAASLLRVTIQAISRKIKRKKS
ncbi:MAG: threonine/serine exporter family protein [Acutalibacteraceae bacterium]|nr:threonine/serine exporter family protein [Acutalibacteraceae bacterium]